MKLLMRVCVSLALVKSLTNCMPKRPGSTKASKKYITEEDRARARRMKYYKVPTPQEESKILSSANKTEGDMDIRDWESYAKLVKEERNYTDTHANAIRNPYVLWPRGRIPYELGDDFNDDQRMLLAAAIEEIERRTCIRWVARLNETNFVYIMNNETGCYSKVADNRVGAQPLNFGKWCWYKGTIIHEMMHTIGFFHEQARNDRDDFVDIIWENIISGLENQFHKLNLSVIDHLNVPYDYSSIMHYESTAFSKNFQDTIVPKKSGAYIGNAEGLSETDALKINKLYKCEELLPKEPLKHKPKKKTRKHKKKKHWDRWQNKDYSRFTG